MSSQEKFFEKDHKEALIFLVSSQFSNLIKFFAHQPYNSLKTLPNYS